MLTALDKVDMIMEAIIPCGNAIDPEKVIVNGNMIYYPTLKMVVSRGGQKELDSGNFSIEIDYDPLIQRDALLVPLAEERQQLFRRIPALVDQADKLEPFRSVKTVQAGWMYFTYIVGDNCMDNILSMQLEHLLLQEARMVELSSTIPKERIRPFLLDAMVEYFHVMDISSVDMVWRPSLQSSPSKIRLLIPIDIARGFFKLDALKIEPDGNYAIVATREFGE